jgi:ribosome-associated translation inhibitor RaiA
LVVLAHDPGKSPGYRAAIHVVTPGPDLHVRAEDHTVRAAFNKAMKQVHSRLDMRDRKRTSRLRGRKQKTAHARFGIGRGGS